MSRLMLNVAQANVVLLPQDDNIMQNMDDGCLYTCIVINCLASHWNGIFAILRSTGLAMNSDTYLSL